MHRVTGMGNDDETLRVILNDDDPDIEQTTFTDGTRPAVSDDDEYAVHTRESAVIFSLKRVRLMYSVVSTVFSCRKLKAILNAHA